MILLIVDRGVKEAYRYEDDQTVAAAQEARDNPYPCAVIAVKEVLYTGKGFDSEFLSKEGENG